MTDSAGPPRDRPAVNPFCVPGWEDSPFRPLRPLCPWNDPTHEDYYIPVDQTHEAFEEFQRRMNNLANLQEDGRLVLVTGESGCGKTALINRCAGWMRGKLRERSLNGIIIDLTEEDVSSPRQSAAERISHVCGRLVDDLSQSQDRLLSVAALQHLANIWDQAHRVYPYLGGALDPGVVLIVLLPPSEDLVEEVIRYAGLARAKLLFFAESSYLDQSQAQRVEGSQPTTRPRPIVLRVGELKPGDVRRYVMERLKRHANTGMYPQMSEETMELVAAAGPLWSVAMLQSIFSRVYEDRRQRKLRYSENDWVTYEDIGDFCVRKSLRYPGMWE